MQLKIVRECYPISKYVLPALLAFSVITKTAIAQTDILHSLQADFKQYSDKQLQEKVYVHTDKNFYLTGELLWFKIYCVEASLHTPLDVSKVAYVEVLDGTNKSVVQAKIALKNGAGDGSVYLPVTLNSGTYRFRAYTNWMKNFGPDVFFERTLTVFNPLKNTTALSGEVVPSYTLSFFPEGGNLVNGLQSKLAFKATDAYGKGIDFKGVVVDESNDTIAGFQPLKFGMGNFLFTPSGNHHYKAIITTASDNKVITKELPTAYNSGYVMRVNSATKGVIVTVQTNASNAGEIYLIAHNGQTIKAAEKAIFNNGLAEFSIDKNKLAEGTTSLTLFNSNKQPIGERLYFIRPEQQLAIDAASDAVQYGSRKPVNIAIATKNKDGKTLPANMSLSVYQLDSLQGDVATDIVNYLWLTSDLKGTIEAPEYYFKNKDAEADEALDNLMLTHGWRRFRWNDIIPNKKTVFAYTPEYYGHLITGKVIDIRTGKPAPTIQTFLSVPGLQPKFYTYKSDDSGNVQFNVKDYYGAGEIIVQTNTAIDTFYRVEVLSPYSEQYSSVTLPPFTLSKNQQQLLDYSISMQVQNAYAKDSMARFALPLIDTLPFYGRPNYAYNLDDYTRFTTMEEVLREYVREINVRKREGKLQMVIVDEPRRNIFESNSLILVDGLPVFDQSRLFSYDPLKVRRLEVITKRYFMGDLYFNGIANFTTYKGELDGFELDPKAIIIDYEGLQLQREFYAPVYETEKQIGSRLPDFRNVLYWSPAINTGAAAKTNVRFYTSDNKGKYLVVLQGITEEGKAGSTSFTFEVK